MPTAWVYNAEWHRLKNPRAMPAGEWYIWPTAITDRGTATPRSNALQGQHSISPMTKAWVYNAEWHRL